MPVWYLAELLTEASVKTWSIINTHHNNVLHNYDSEDQVSYHVRQNINLSNIGCVDFKLLYTKLVSSVVSRDLLLVDESQLVGMWWNFLFDDETNL